MKRWMWVILLLVLGGVFVGCSEKGTETNDNISSSSGFFFSSSVEVIWEKGTGTANDPFLIKSVQDLVDLSEAVSNGNTYEGIFFKQGADISLKGISWTSIGVWGEDDLGWGNKPFRGSFDGATYSISDLKMDNASASYVGLFGLVKKAIIKNVNLKNASLTGNKIIGGLVAKSDSTTISDCSTDVIISGQERLGGVVGEMLDGSITGTTVKGFVDGKSTVGGVVGLVGSRAAVTAVNSAVITGTMQNTGGIAGTLSGGVVTGSSNKGTVSGVINVGGIVGNSTMSGTISWSFNEAKVTASGANSFVGGIVGDLSSASKLSTSYNLGAVSSTGLYAAGIVGKMTGSELNDVFNHGAISATNYAAGLVAKCGEDAKIHTGYNKGSVSVVKNSSSLLAETLSTIDSSGLYYDNVLALVTSSELGGMASAEMTSNAFASTLNGGTKSFWTWTAGTMSNYPYLLKQ
ncbi:MAG TPA: hypothetical protein GX724_02945 [Fibrobacter sp.]|nr:hypothetical protein [Fibrobacter sp.]